MLTGSSTSHANGESLYADLVMENWLAWSQHDESDHVASPHFVQPRRDSVPASLRRRLSPTGLATCSILSSLVAGDNIPVIYASRHGRAGNTLKLMKELSTEDSLSPSRFSLSVHNAVAGIYTIATHHVSSIQAISACGDELQALALEAAAYLRTGAPAIVTVFAEEPFPEIYQDHVSGPDQGCVVGMRLSLSSERQQYPAMPALPMQHGATPLDAMQWLSRHSPYTEDTL